MDKPQSKVQVKILLPGYVSADSGGRTRPTMTLIRNDDHIILSDPGVISNHMIILDALKAEKLSPDDVDIIFITHGHTDHTRNAGLFPKAKILDYWGWWIDDLFEDYHPGDLGSEINIINTPGHSYDSISMIIQTAGGKITICGDVFWKKDFPNPDPFAEDQKVLEKSRLLVQRSANFIIPGHGEMFKNKL